ncbi:MAG TPA: AAA family ATPase [Acidimicrobiales bacterium]|jgi:hypothetical protein
MADVAGDGAGELEFETGTFARAFQQFLITTNQLVPRERSPIRDLLEQHIGADPGAFPAVSEDLVRPELPNLQRALDELVEDHGWDVVGLPLGLRNFDGFSLASIATDRLSDYRLASPRPGPVEYTNVPVGPDETMACVQLALYLGRWRDLPLAVLVSLGDPRRHQSTITVEVLTSTRDGARGFLDHLRERRAALNVYRGKTLSFVHTQFGEYGLNFLTLPRPERSQVILPEDDLSAIEQHTIGIADKAAVLLAAGRHLRRGLLLHGPPGTGKTLSVSYLCNRMSDRTTVVLNGGPGINAMGQAIALARAAQPAMVVLEDVDLVGEERTRPGRQDSNPLLFQLLNEMDGLAEDSDIIFVLTTNRLDLLEPALAMRPGRIDQAVEVKLPDAYCRRRLFELYLDGVPMGEVSIGLLVDATDGVSAAFVKELVRRAVLIAAMESDDGTAGLPPIETRHLQEGLAALDASNGPVMRAILGATHPA